MNPNSRNNFGMNNKIVCFLLTILIALSVPAIAIANEHENPSDPGGSPDAAVPIDGGLSVLIAAGVGYGIKKIRDERKRASNDNEK